MKISIIDYEVGNIFNLTRAFDFLGVQVDLTRDPNQIRESDKLILPGVGAFRSGITNLKKLGLDQEIKDFYKSGKPLLGICLGMQLMFENSAEGDTAGLRIVPGRVVRLEASVHRPVPHMGWNTLLACQPDALRANIAAQDRVYFVHSFAAPVGPWTTATCEYGSEFSAVLKGLLQRGVCGFQTV